MKRFIQIAVTGISILLGQTAFAADCPDITGDWKFDLQCVGIPTNPNPGGDRIIWAENYLMRGEVASQHGCVFTGTLKGIDWVGALHGIKKKQVLADFGHATLVGTLTGRDNISDKMSITYVFPGDAGGVETTQTACTGEGVRAD